MNELEWAVFFGRVAWVVSILAPTAVGVLTALIANRPNTDQVRTGFTGALAAIALGAAGSFLHGDRIVSTLMGSGDIPYYLVASALHRMWYPLGISLVVGVALALFTLLPKRLAA